MSHNKISPEQAAALLAAGSNYSAENYERDLLSQVVDVKPYAPPSATPAAEAVTVHKFSKEQQTSLEAALRKYKQQTLDRWDLIAAEVVTIDIYF